MPQRIQILLIILLASCSNKIKYTGTHFKGADKKRDLSDVVRIMIIEVEPLITGAISFVAVLFVSFIIWFLKTVYSDHKLVFEYYTKNKEADIHKIMLDMANLKGEMEKVESESKRYWAEQRERATTNYNSLLDRINHTNENNKNSSKGIIEYLERLEKKIERLEDKLDNKVDK